MKVNIDHQYIFNTWAKPLSKIFDTIYFNKLLMFLNDAYSVANCTPEKVNIFKVFEITNYNEIKVVILGKDPYPNSMATGLAFANRDNLSRLSPSLIKIKECIENTIYKGFNVDFNPELTEWADQGVLLLNTALTVQKGRIGSHQVYWRKFTEHVLNVINENNSGIIFMLWGKDAQKYKCFINDKKHYIMEFNHPAWAARNNIKWECPHFKNANLLIENNNGREFCIEW